MPSNLPSARFALIYDSLPREAQCALVEKQLIPLLNIVPKDKAKKVISTGTRLQTRYSGAPFLDLKAKKKEINSLLDGLGRESKRSFLKERSNKDEYLAEAIESLVDWLSDIWSTVYEHNVNFALAHSCLVFTADVLDHILNIHGGCKCSIMSMFVPVTLRGKSGTTVKSFSLTGAHKIDSVLLWIWRDLFVSLSATGTPAERRLIPDMLVDIEGIMGWQALERLLYGGKKSYDDDDDDEDKDDDSFFQDECYEDEDEDEDDEDGDVRCPCYYHASHWSSRINCQRVQLREFVQERLTTIFGISPTIDLYNSILSISVDTDATAHELQDLLSSAATSCSENFAAALDIHISENNTEDILALLDSQLHLLRPRDATTLQSAVTLLSDSPVFHLRGLQIVEKELLDSARTIHTALLSCFSNIDEDVHREEISQITALRAGSPTRHDRVEHWVDAVVTPGSQQPNPVNFAALLMGIPIPPAMEDGGDGDPLGYLDVDENDPDLEDLSEEFRPNLKERFEGWNETALSIQGGPALLLDVYVKLMDLMPFLRAADAVDEMIGRLVDKPSKHHVCDALDSLSTFSKLQRKKILLRDKKRKTESQSPSLPNAGMGPAFAFSLHVNNTLASSSSGMYPLHIGGMDDVD